MCAEGAPHPRARATVRTLPCPQPDDALPGRNPRIFSQGPARIVTERAKKFLERTERDDRTRTSGTQDGFRCGGAG